MRIAATASLSPSATAQPLPAPIGEFNVSSQVVVLEFSVPVGNSHLAEATAFDAAGLAPVCGSTRFNVPSSGPDPQVSLNLTALGCQP